MLYRRALDYISHIYYQMSLEADRISSMPYQLLLNEIVKYVVLKDANDPQNLYEVLTKLSGTPLKMKQKELKRLAIGTGKRIVENMVQDHVWLRDSHAFMRFICKEFWNYFFGKYVDRLQTNNKGVYVLFDYKFAWQSSWTFEPVNDESTEAVRRLSLLYLAYATGLIKGGMQSLGIEAECSAEIEEGACKITIKLGS